MKIVFYLKSVSPHQLPLAQELVRWVGYGDVLYLYTDDFTSERAALGWSSETKGVRVEKLTMKNCHYLYDAELLYTGVRDLDVIEFRTERGLKTLYHSERWFKPIDIGSRMKMPRLELLLPGRYRMLVPMYRRMVKRFVGTTKCSTCFRILPIGPWARVDFLKMGVPESSMVDWAYFVEPSVNPKSDHQLEEFTHVLHVLYVGRFLALKHVDTIIRAVAQANKDLAKKHCQPSTFNSLSLTIVGSGPEESRLKKLASNLAPTTDNQPFTTFLPPVPIKEVRSLMRQHDVLVFASNALEGWGAVVSEALSEGVPAIGTFETGASAAMLPSSQLFHSGDWRGLAARLCALDFKRCVSTIDSRFTPAWAAEKMLNL